MIHARDVMSTSVLNIEKGTSVSQAARIMTGQHVGSVIITAADFPVGIATETDITRVIAQGKDPNTVMIEEIMSSPLFSTSPDVDIIQIANTMAANHIKKMPVLERQRVVGVITQTDIIKHVLRMCTTLNEQYKDGSMNAQGFQYFAACTTDLYNSVKSGLQNTKHWHMRCQNCGHRFMAQETDGKLEHEDCPKCHGPISYDAAPPV